MALAPAPTPPRGWNSWDCYGTTVTEAEVLANAEFMAEHLAQFGWDTVVVDINWADPTAKSHGYNEGAPLAMDEFGRLIPDPVRFQSSAGGKGFGPLAQKVHDLGLKFGIHIMRGIPRIATAANTPIKGTPYFAQDVADPQNRCVWNPDMDGLNPDHPAFLAYYHSIFELYAQWGVDFIKADDILGPYQARDVEALHEAITQAGRPMQLSLSPGRNVSTSRVDHLRQHATMWRICDDLWDQWEDVEANFARFARWAPLASPDGWPDGDMLPLGHIGIRAERGQDRQSLLTLTEQTTLLTLWCFARSPLMFGGNLPTSNPATVELLTHEPILEVQAQSHNNREVLREGDLILWAADPGYGAAFNTGEEPLEITLDLDDFGWGTVAATSKLTDLWSGSELPWQHSSHPIRPQLTITIPPHGVRAFKLHQ